MQAGAKPVPQAQNATGEMRAPLNSSHGPPIARGLAYLCRCYVWPRCGEQKTQMYVNGSCGSSI